MPCPIGHGKRGLLTENDSQNVWSYQIGHDKLIADMYAHKVLTITEAFAQILRDAKNESGMSWPQIAEASGIAESTVKRIAGLAGRRYTSPTLEQLADLARVFKADPNDWYAAAEKLRMESEHAAR